MSRDGNLPLGDRRHGLNGYNNLGCRCPVCRRANKIYCLDMRERREGTLAVDDERHGKPATYCNYKCRCAPCTNAHRIACADQRARRDASKGLL